MNAAFERIDNLVRTLTAQTGPITPVSQDEVELSIHLRTNDMLYELLKSIITKRITGRAKVVEPTNPIDCKVLLARDGECRWFLNLLESARQLPRQDSEHPAGR